MGTQAWTNWRAFEPDVEAIEDCDDELHSDRQFVGGPVSHGPYTITPVMRRSYAAGDVGEAVILHERIHTSLIPEVVVDGKLVKADSSAYHGGTVADEIAALISLELGVRLRFAGMRQSSGIRYPDEPARPPFVLEVARLSRPGARNMELLPAVRQRPASLDQVELLSSFPHLDESSQTELVRAARSYSDAIWWANEDPNQAWLQLVTAVETASKCRQMVSASADDLVKMHWPQLWDALVGSDDPPGRRCASWWHPR